jgi:hypothetical protein
MEDDIDLDLLIDIKKKKEEFKQEQLELELPNYLDFPKQEINPQVKINNNIIIIDL